MNPLKSILGTIVSGFILAVIIAVLLGGFSFNLSSMMVWLHVIVGIVWIGLLYYFNFVQVPAVGQALADKDPGPAAINKYVAPRALLWFRWSAVVTWLTGVAMLEIHKLGFVQTFLFKNPSELAITLSIGAWLGTIMLFNVWVLIWPNQKKILGKVSATDEAIAKAKVIALMASRTNTLLSIPLLMCMVAWGHGGLAF
ncbi:MAG: urate hydroxylase PuuD [Thiotrichaceae bacterium]|nr:urate hydroxylase PuuD [Thiotrichaceae bacterium]